MEPHSLPVDWQPNRTHKITAARLGLDLGEVVTEFLASQAATEKRADWHKTFSRFMNDYADGDHWETAVGW